MLPPAAESERVFIHDLFRNHVADPQGNHWEDGQFVSRCEICGRAMVKPPGGDWKLQPKRRAS